MLAFDKIACVFLFSCWTKLLTKDDFEYCPDFCDCYSAPEDGMADDIAYSVMCDYNLLTPQNAETYSKLNSIKTSINTLVFDQFSIFNSLKPLNKIKVNNLVLKDIGMTGSDIVSRIDNVMDGINTDSLQVLTLLNANFKEIFQFKDPNIKNFNKLKVIYIESGKLVHLTDEFAQIPGHNVFSVTIDSVGLKDVDKSAFKDYAKLRMLTIIRNSIQSLSWIVDLDFPELWYLDLRHNQINSFPPKLAQLKSLKVLKLGQNKIRVINGNTIDLLIPKLTEFSFDKIPATGDKPGQTVAKQDYFYPTQEMSWIVDVLQLDEKYKTIPKYIYEALKQIECIKTGATVNVPCHELRKEQFNFKVSNELTTIIVNSDDTDSANDEYTFSYENQRVFLAGAVLPYDTDILTESSDSTSKYFKYIRDNGGNVAKIAVHWENWYINIKTVGSLSSYIFDIDKFEEDIQKFETFLGFANNKDNNIFVIITLWTADKSPIETLKYIAEDTNFDYLKKLKILVERLSKYKSLAAWELFDDPNKLLVVASSTDKCGNTDNIAPATTVTNGIEIKTMQAFIAQQAKLIHSVMPLKLVTVTISEVYSRRFNLYEDQCLKSAMDDQNQDDIYLDFYTLYIDDAITIDGAKGVSEKSPKPVVLIASRTSSHIQQIITHFYATEHEGILGCYDDSNTVINDLINNGIKEFKGYQTSIVIGPAYDNPNID